jgi:Fe-S cluster assembly protein SufD
MNLDSVRSALAARLASRAAGTTELTTLLDRLEQQGLPGPRDDAWRYAPWARLAGQAMTPPSSAEANDLPPLPATPAGYERIVLVNGRAEAATATSLETTQATDDALLEHNSFALLNALFADSTAAYDAPPGTLRRIHIVIATTAHGGAGLLPIHLRLRATAGSTCEVLEEHVGVGGPGLCSNLVIDAQVQEGARFAWQRLLPAHADARHIETLRLRLAANSSAHVLQVLPGCAALRSTAIATLDGADADLRHDSLAIGDGSQQLDQHVLIDHRGERSRSQETYRGLAASQARVAFTGHNRVRPGAVNTDSRQSLRCLVAGADAEAIARPQLEILTDAVQASHGATVGTLDAQMLFYLLSRGLDPATAQSLLKWAFLQDVLARAQPGEWRARLEEQLLARLHDPTLAGLSS